MTFRIRDLFLATGFAAVVTFVFTQIDVISGFLFSAGVIVAALPRFLKSRRSIQVVALGVCTILLWLLVSPSGLLKFKWEKQTVRTLAISNGKTIRYWQLRSRSPSRAEISWGGI